MDSTRLTQGQPALLDALHDLADADGYVTVGVVGLARRLGKAEAAVARTLRIFARRGFVEVVHQGGNHRGDRSILRVVR